MSLANKINLIRNKIPALMTIQAKRAKPWFMINGDKTLRLNYGDLNEQSVVFDLGGYEGQWASDIYAKYNCFVFIFEPVIAFADDIKERFANNKKIRVFSFGLSSQNSVVNISLSANASSTYKANAKNTQQITLKSVQEFLQNENITSIDLMKVNIEGGEYDLLDSLIENGFINKIKNIQVQFHDFVPDAEIRMKKIQSQLSKTHETTYQYPFIWENWRLIGA